MENFHEAIFSVKILSLSNCKAAVYSKLCARN